MITRHWEWRQSLWNGGAKGRKFLGDMATSRVSKHRLDPDTTFRFIAWYAAVEWSPFVHKYIDSWNMRSKMVDKGDQTIEKLPWIHDRVTATPDNTQMKAEIIMSCYTSASSGWEKGVTRPLRWDSGTANNINILHPLPAIPPILPPIITLLLEGKVTLN